MSAPVRICVLGVSYKTAAVSLRERLAFRESEIAVTLQKLTTEVGCQEALILSTCNRVEIYTVYHALNDEFPARLQKFLANHHGVDEEELKPSLYLLNDQLAAHHLFQVVSSLDSQVIGETEIAGQVKNAYRLAQECACIGRVLRFAFERAFFLAKEIRCEGGLGNIQASISSAAVQLAEKIFERLNGQKVLVLGTGEMAAGIVRALKASGVSDLLVASRTQERAQEFAMREGGRCAPIERLIEHLTEVDIALVSTAAPHHIVLVEQIQQVLARRHGRPLFIIDISVPRNVDPEINRFDDIFLFDIDDLEKVAQEGREQREAISRQWQPRLQQEAQMLLNQVAEAGPEELAKLLMAELERIKHQELAWHCSQGLDAQQLALLERALERLGRKLLHSPLTELRNAVREGEGGPAAHWLNRFFKLNESNECNEAGKMANSLKPGNTQRKG